MAYYFDELIVSELRKENNTMALRELYRTHFPTIRNLVCANNGTEQEAKDIYQETVIAFFERVRHPDFVLTCQIRTFLYAVARRLWLKRLSEKKRFRGHINEAETFDQIEETLQEMEESEKRLSFIAKSLDGLGQPCRGIIEDFYMNDLSMEAIRDKHGYTNAETAKNQKYKCLQRLKKLFFSHYNS